MEYKDFKLCIEAGNGGSYEVEAEAPEEAEERGEFSLLLSEAEVAELRVSLSDGAIDKHFLITYGDAIREGLLRPVEGKTYDDYLIAYGKTLHRHLFGERVGPFFDSKYGEFASKTSSGLRVRLTSEPAEAEALPWELLYDSTRGCFLATSTKMPLTRYVKLKTSVRDFGVEPPVKILVVIPHAPGLDAEREKGIIEKSFERLQDAFPFQLDYLEGAVTLTALHERLTTTPYHIIHFIGHGGFSGGRGYLVISPDGEHLNPLLARGHLDGEVLGAVLAQHPSVKLVLLNSCQGATTGPAKPLTGVAQQLALNDVPAVIAMQHAIADKVAINFSRLFYLRLCAGEDRGRVDAAVSYARDALRHEFKDLPRIFSAFALPVLYLRSRTGLIFKLKEGESPLPPYSYVQRRTDYEKVHRENLVEVVKERTDKEQQGAPPAELAALDREIEREKGEIKTVRAEVRRWYATVFLVLATAVAGVVFAYMGVFGLLNLDDRMETAFIKVMNGWFGDKQPLTRTRIVMADPGDYGSHIPLLRPKHVDLLRALGGRARVVVFAFSFDDPQPVDDALGRAIADARAKGTQVVLGVRKCLKGDVGKLAECRRVGQLFPPAPGLSGAPWGVSTAFFSNERTGHYRFYSVATDPESRGEGARGDEITEPSLALRALLHLRSADGQPAAAFYDREEQVVRLPPGGTESDVARIPVDPVEENLLMYIDFASMADTEQVEREYGRVLESAERLERRARGEAVGDDEARVSQLYLDDFRDSIVLVGARTEAGRGDISDSERRYGVEIHANVISNVLRGNYIHPLRRTGVSYLILAGMAALGVAIPIRFGRVVRARLPGGGRFNLLLVIAPALYVLAAVLLYKNWRLLFDMYYHLAAFFLAYGVTVLFRKKFGLRLY
jgi:CHASE2 domain-containing sensor protein